MSLFMQWLLIGVVLTILELIIPGTYLIWFGCAAMVMAGIVYFIPDISLLAQLVSVGFLSVGFALLGVESLRPIDFSDQYARRIQEIK